MKCPKCNGKGYVYNALGSFNEDCGHCQGTGKVRVEGEPMTNEEWLKQANTEQFAEWVVKVVFGDEFKKHIRQIGFAHMHSYKTEVVEWLKQPHIKE